MVTITGLIILGIVLDLGGGPSHDRIGFRYWKRPGPFTQYAGIAGAEGRFLGWWAVMTQAAFSFVGTEVVAIAGAEAKNPRRNIPRAIRNVYIRLLLFYIGGVTIIGLLVPYTDDRLDLATGTAAASPFVIAIQMAGIKGLPSVCGLFVPPATMMLIRGGLRPAHQRVYPHLGVVRGKQRSILRLARTL